MSSSRVKKLCRVDISASQKQDLCSFKEENPKSTQADILVHISKEWGVTVGRSTVSDILKHNAKWLAITKVCSGALRVKSAK